MTGGFDFMKLMQQAGQLQEKVNEQKEEMKKKLFTAESGAGMVKATVNGMMDVVSIEVDPKAIESLGLASVMELVVAAINEAIKRARDGAQGDVMSLFQNMAGGLFNPGGDT